MPVSLLEQVSRGSNHGEASTALCREQPFWDGIGAAWRQLGGGMVNTGFSFEWHEWTGEGAVDWARSFHPQSVEICLNLSGLGWVAAGDHRLEFGPDVAGFFLNCGRGLEANRYGQEQHRFLSVEFCLPFLRQHLASEPGSLHPLVRQCLDAPRMGVSEPLTLTCRHRELLRALLQPPVLGSAQRLWYKSKALEFASEFFYVGEKDQPACTRAKHLAQERVSRVKSVLLENLEEPPSLEELGRRVGCSPYYLSRTFTQETGATISQWLRQARLERAAELLRSGKANVTEAALQVGYSSLSHFSQAFHEAFGCCPGLYPLRTTAQPRTGHKTR